MRDCEMPGFGLNSGQDGGGGDVIKAIVRDIRETVEAQE
jgi:hypothetical protein